LGAHGLDIAGSAYSSSGRGISDGGPCNKPACFVVVIIIIIIFDFIGFDIDDILVIVILFITCATCVRVAFNLGIHVFVIVSGGVRSTKSGM